MVGHANLLYVVTTLSAVTLHGTASVPLKLLQILHVTTASADPVVPILLHVISMQVPRAMMAHVLTQDVTILLQPTTIRLPDVMMVHAFTRLPTMVLVERSGLL
jgi:hypothetical protein